MDWHRQKKLKKAMRRTFALLLAVLTLNSSARAVHLGGFSLSDYVTQMLERDAQKRQQEQQRQLRELYGDDWEKVAALQPGESYISGDNMYVCHEETYVDWKKVQTAEDLDPAGWGGEERLLLMTDASGKKLFVGNDYAVKIATVEGVEDETALMAYDYDAVRKVISGVTRDTSGLGTPEYVEEFVFPEMYQLRKESSDYPDTFRTLGTMNAPYIEYMGLDSENGNHRKFNIIMAKDDGSKSAVALSHNSDCDELQLRAVSECSGFTFYMKDGELKIFENIEDEDDLKLHFYTRSGVASLTGQTFETLEEMTTSNVQLFLGEKSVGKRIEVISLKLEDAEQNPEALENVYGGAIEFYRWEKITSSSQLPTGSDTYRALLVWNDKYFLQGDDFRKHSDNDGMAFYVNEENKRGAAPGNVAEVPEIDLSQSEFYTVGGMGTPYIRFTGHKDKNKNNDACPYYSFQLAGMDDQPSGKWLCDGDNILDVCLDGAATKHGGVDVGIIVGREAADHNDADPGKVKLFFNDASGYDTGFDWAGNVFYGDDDMWSWDYGQFTLYIGKPVVYPAVRQNYVVGEDQFMHISQNGAMLKNVTITVAKGGVLSVESWFMNNGRIVVDGGTLIVQEASNPLGDEETDDTEDSVMLPFVDIHPTVSGSLELKNGGELIVLDNTRAAFSSITATNGSSIFNNGMLLAETITLKDSTLENRPGMTVFVGYDFRRMVKFRNGSVSQIVADLASKLQTDVPCINQGSNSSILNDGTVRHSTPQKPVEDGSAKQSGGGSYEHLRGKVGK